MELETRRFYERAIQQVTDAAVRKLLGDLAEAERKHSAAAAALEQTLLTDEARQGEDALLQLSRRAKLVLRLPAHRAEEASALVGRTLQVAGSSLRVEKMALRPLSRITTLFSRCVVLAAEDEAVFVGAATEELGALGIRAQRMVCGRMTTVATPDRTYQARSLMLAGLTLEQSLLLQRSGLGAGRKLGCGLFIPHKDIADLRSRSE